MTTDEPGRDDSAATTDASGVYKRAQVAKRDAGGSTRVSVTRSSVMGAFVSTVIVRGVRKSISVPVDVVRERRKRENLRANRPDLQDEPPSA
jgi:hypothetical protein